jgi:hypothetical protein
MKKIKALNGEESNGDITRGAGEVATKTGGGPPDDDEAGSSSSSSSSEETKDGHTAGNTAGGTPAANGKKLSQH